METNRDNAVKRNAGWGPFTAVVLAGLLLTTLSLFTEHRWSKEMSTARLREDGERYATRTSKILDRYATVLGAVSGLFVSSERVTRDEYAAFLEYFLSTHPAIRAVAWIPLREEGAGKIEYLEPGPWGDLRTGTALGLLESWEEALEGGAVELFAFPSGGEGEVGARHVLLTTRLGVDAGGDAARGGPDGIIAAVVSTEQALGQSFDPLGNGPRDVFVFSTGAQGSPALLAMNGEEPVTLAELRSRPRHEVTFRFGGRDLLVITARPDGGDGATYRPSFWITLAVGLLCTVLVALWIRDMKNASDNARVFAEQQYRSRRELEHLYDLQRRIMHLARMGIWEYDSRSRIIKLSEESARILGVFPEEMSISRERFLELVHESDREAVAVAFRDSLMSEDEEVNVDHRIVRGDEEVRSVHEEFCKVRDEAGEVVGLEGFLQDTEDRVRMLDLVMQSEKMMSVGGLAAGMAHEINNPLAAILQSAANMQNRLSRMIDSAPNVKAAREAGTDTEAIRRFMEARGILRMVESIESSGQRAAHIVRNMLSFARKSDGGAAPTVMENLIGRTLELAGTDWDMKKSYDFKQVRVERDFAPDLPTISCDEARLQQVFLNILRNAAQAMREAGTDDPTIRVGARLTETGRGMRVEIGDNGPGVDEAIRRRMFKPFFTTKPPGQGTGLGLSVSYFIVKDVHKGEMMVESEPGKGTKFIIELPLART